jgi:hypothetical protein
LVSVAKPAIEYVNNLKLQTGISGTFGLLRKLLKYYKPYLPIVGLVLVLAYL